VNSGHHRKWLHQIFHMTIEEIIGCQISDFKMDMMEWLVIEFDLEKCRAKDFDIQEVSKIFSETTGIAINAKLGKCLIPK